MAVPGEPFDDCLVEPLTRVRAAFPADTRWLDVHTHTGFDDPDGVTGSVGELLAGLDRAGVEEAVVFTTAEPGGYPPANDRVLAEAAASGGRLRAFARLDPNAGDPGPEARRCLDAGARGFKLHPRSDAFVLSHPSVEALFAIAQEAGLPVLVHAGRGIPALGEDLVRLARRFDRVPVILAHAGISDLGLVAPAAAEVRNLLFDTAWWQVADLLALFTAVGAGQILFASDMPYGSARFAALLFARCARAAGLDGDALRAVAGDNARRALAGQPAADLGPPPGPAGLGPRWLAGERVVAYAGAAVQLAFRGGDPTEALALARLACQVPDDGAAGADGPRLAELDGLLAHGLELLAAHPDTPRQVAYPALGAQALAGTPSVT